MCIGTEKLEWTRSSTQGSATSSKGQAGVTVEQNGQHWLHLREIEAQSFWRAARFCLLLSFDVSLKGHDANNGSVYGGSGSSDLRSMSLPNRPLVEGHRLPLSKPIGGYVILVKAKERVVTERRPINLSGKSMTTWVRSQTPRVYSTRPKTKNTIPWASTQLTTTCLGKRHERYNRMCSRRDSVVVPDRRCPESRYGCLKYEQNSSRTSLQRYYIGYSLISTQCFDSPALGLRVRWS